MAKMAAKAADDIRFLIFTFLVIYIITAGLTTMQSV